MGIESIVKANTYSHQIILPNIDKEKMAAAIARGDKVMICREWEGGSYSYGPQICKINDGIISDISHPFTNDLCQVLNIVTDDHILHGLRPGEFESNGRGSQYKSILAIAIPKEYTGYVLEAVYGEDAGNTIFCPTGMRDIFIKHYSKWELDDILELDCFVTVDEFEAVMSLAAESDRPVVYF